MVINLRAETASLNKDLGNASRSVSKFAAETKSVLREIGFGLSLAGLGESIHELAQYESSISTAAAQTGMATEQISALGFATKNFNIPLQELSVGFVHLDQAISGVGRSGKVGATVLAALGVSAKDSQGNVRPLHDVLLDVADKFSKFEDGAKKTAIASALFGMAAGPQLIPFLDKGKAGIKGLEAEAARLGVTLSSQDVVAGEQFEQALAGLEGVIRSLEVQAGKVLLPALALIAEAFTGDGDAAGAFSNEILELEDTINAAGADFNLFFDRIDLRLDTWLYKHHLGFKSVMDAAQANLQNDQRLAAQAQSDYAGHLSAMEALYESFQRKMEALGSQAAGHGDSPVMPVSGKKKHKKDKAMEEYLSGLREYDSLLGRLRPKVDAVQVAYTRYLETMIKLSELQAKGVNVTQGAMFAQLREQRELTDALSKSQKELAKSYQDIFKEGYVSLDSSMVFSPGPVLNQHQLKMLKLKDLTHQFAKEERHAFDQAIVYGKGWGSVLDTLLKKMLSLVLETQVFARLAGAFSGKGGFEGVMGSIFSGLSGRASGGPVTAGEMYMVGESGPEVFVPGASGTIVPSGRAAGGMNVNIDARGADAGAEHRVRAAMEAFRKQFLGQSLVLSYDYRRRGGNI